jgi:fumarate hydratase class II
VVHPNDHVNLGQSSNDVIPTALHLAGLLAIHEVLEPAVETLRRDLEVKSKEFWGVVKTGRTHLQDATPIRLGQVFLGYAGQMERAKRRLAHAREELQSVPLGGTAVGTGVNTHPEFARQVCAKVSVAAGVTIRETDNHFQAQATLDAVVEAMGSVRTVAVSLLKIANDVRLLASGPRCGLGELRIPEVQPGSSIMPGKVNPVIAEALIMAVAQTIAADQAVLQSGQWGFFELNTMMPVAAHNFVQAVEVLGAATRGFAERCVRGQPPPPGARRWWSRASPSAPASFPTWGTTRRPRWRRRRRRPGAPCARSRPPPPGSRASSSTRRSTPSR